MDILHLSKKPTVFTFSNRYNSLLLLAPPGNLIDIICFQSCIYCPDLWSEGTDLTWPCSLETAFKEINSL